ncbi:MAG: L-histidine N(alpha)-methyltransferase [Pseudomonadota bacterium]
MTTNTNRLADVSQQSADDCAALREILAGLSLPQKTLSPKFFYDERGSELFEEITRLPEYYLTGTERRIMQNNIGAIADLVGEHASLIEFGAGSNEKIRLLLKHLHSPAVYVPVDISADYLAAAAEDLAQDFPHIEILPVAADFTRPFDLPNPRIAPRRNIVYFPGSTIGNFSRNDALNLLEVMYLEAGADGGLLIGVDLQKDKDVIERAYNDSAGVTADFNLNALHHLNREFDATFNVDAFEHQAIYNDDPGRIEMYLISLEDQTFDVADRGFSMTKGERILTEYSHKYSLEGFAALAAQAGFTVEQVFTDDNEWFSVQYCTRR